MLQVKCLCLVLVLCLCGAMGAHADGAVSPDEAIKVQCPDDFSLHSVDVGEDGTFLLAGNTNAAPLLMRVDASGNVLWNLEGEPLNDTLSSFYRDARFLADGSIVALRTNGDDWRMEFIRDGEIVSFEDTSKYILRIFPVSEGFLINYAMESSEKNKRVALLDMQGKQLWEHDFQANTRISGVGAFEDGFVLYGNTTINPSGNYDDYEMRSVVLGMSKDGDVLWQHADDAMRREELYTGTVTGDGRVVVAGYVVATEQQRESGDTSNWGTYLAEYNKDGQVWRKYYSFGTGRDKDSILPVDQGYLCAMGAPEGRDGLRMMLTDFEGNPLKEWFESTGDLVVTSEAALKPIGDKVFLVMYGNDGSYSEDEPSRQELRLLAINEVNIPQ